MYLITIFLAISDSFYFNTFFFILALFKIKQNKTKIKNYIFNYVFKI